MKEIRAVIDPHRPRLQFASAFIHSSYERPLQLRHTCPSVDAPKKWRVATSFQASKLRLFHQRDLPVELQPKPSTPGLCNPYLWTPLLQPSPQQDQPALQ